MAPHLDAMSNPSTTDQQLPAGCTVPFRAAVLAAHDDPPPTDPAPPADPPADPPPDPADPGDPPADPPGDPADAGEGARRALAREREARRRAEAEARVNREAAARLKQLEDAQKSETERLQDAARTAQERAAAAERRAVAAEIRALATDGFADATDAVEALGGDVARFLDPAGGIDEAAIRDALDGLLERKPHWRKPAPASTGQLSPPAPATPPTPRPDPSQGPRDPAPPTDFTKAPHEDFVAEAARLGVRVL